MSVKDSCLLSRLFASKRCLHLPKADLDAFLSVLLTGNVARQAKKIDPRRTFEPFDGFLGVLVFGSV